MSEAKSLKETMEVLAALELLALSVKEVMKDGKVDLADLAILVKVASQAEVFVKAVEGVGEVVPEAKDIDAAEAVALVTRLFEIVGKVKAA